MDHSLMQGFQQKPFRVIQVLKKPGVKNRTTALKLIRESSFKISFYWCRSAGNAEQSLDFPDLPWKYWKAFQLSRCPASTA